jgi:type I restriction enzyme S subunit
METVRLGDLCEVITKGTTPTTLGMKLNEGFVNFIKVECLSEDGQIIRDKIQNIDQETHSKLKRSQLQVGDILFSIAGSIGRMAIVTNDFLPANTNQAVAILRPKVELVDTEFLFYFLRDVKSQSDARRRIVQSVQSNLSLGELSNLQVFLPPRETQIAISSFMKKLDEKIILNRFISRNLEEISQTIFKSWFVDFNPVKAKMAGEKPVGMDDATAALFPDSMADSELGSIPTGWVVKKVDDVLERIKVKAMPKSTSVTPLGRTLVLEQGDLLISGFIEDDASVEASVKNPRFIFGDHTCRMYLSTLPFSVFPNTIVLTSHLVNPYFAYWVTRDTQKFESYRRHWMELAFRKVVVPSPDIANKWGELVSSIHAQLDMLMIDSRQLAAVRDALLPRLISGELQIPAEMLVS